MIIFINLFLAVLGLCCCLGSSLVAASGGCSLIAVHGLLIAAQCCSLWSTGSSTRASGVMARGLRAWGSWTLEHRPRSCGTWA